MQVSTEILQTLNSIIDENGTEFIESDCLEVNSQNDLPFFVKVQDFFKIEGKMFVGALILITIGFSTTYFGYAVELTNKLIVIPFDDVIKKVL